MAKARSYKSSGDIRKDLTDAQLSGIGAVTIAYNEIDILIHILVSLALGLLTNTANEVTGRIHGVDGLIEIAKIAMREIGASDEVMALLGDTFGKLGFAQCKKRRDAVIHARVLDGPAGIGMSKGKRGAVQEILLTTYALNDLYERLRLLRLELFEACNIAIRLRTEFRFGPIRKIAETLHPDKDRAGQIADLPIRQIEQEIQACLARYREHQKSRLSLGPPPKVPEESLVPEETES
jgi:hypothetical protein